MKVYVVTREPFHNNSTILSAHTTLAGAERSVPDAPGSHGTARDGSPRGKWSREGFYIDSTGDHGTNPRRCTNAVSQRPSLEKETDPDFTDPEDHLICELDLQEDQEIP